MNVRLATIFLLYVCQGLPGGFLAVVLPVLLRERGQDLATVGAVSVLSLPWLLKFLWAPAVDRVFVARWGRRRTWLLPAQAGMIAASLACAWLSPERHLACVAALFLVINVFAATQDIASDGLAVDETVRAPMRAGSVNAAQVAGFKLGNVLGGGVLLMLVDRLGWAGSFVGMATCLALVWLRIWFLREDSPPPLAPLTHVAKTTTVRAIFAAAPLSLWVFLPLAKFGESLGGAMAKPLLVDNGFSKASIGLLDGTLGGGSTIVGALVGGWVVRRFGWAKVAFAAAVGQGMGLAALAWVVPWAPTVWHAAPVVMLEQSCGGAFAVAVFALAMRACTAQHGASQFTVMQVIYMSGAFAAAPLAGVVAQTWGYSLLFACSGVLTLGVGALAMRMPLQREKSCDHARHADHGG